MLLSQKVLALKSQEFWSENFDNILLSPTWVSKICFNFLLIFRMSLILRPDQKLVSFLNSEFEFKYLILFSHHNISENKADLLVYYYIFCSVL